MSEVNIRIKPTKVQLSNKSKENEFIPPSPELIDKDLKAAVVQMDSIESVPPNKFKVKDPPTRSPAPLPEAVSPAGVPIDLSSPETKDLEKSEFKIDLSAIEGVDMTVEGKKPEEYKRNMKGTLVVISLLLASFHLFLNHLTMFTWVVNFDSPELVIAAVLYIISTILILVMFLSALVVPALSIGKDKLGVYYSPIIVAGVIDFMAVWMGGGIFSPLSLYTLDSMNYLYYNQIGALMTVVINGLLYYSFTRNEGLLASLFHPFEVLRQAETEKFDQID